MKSKKPLIFLLVLCMISLAGCGAPQWLFAKTPEQDAMMVKAFNAVENGEYYTFYTMLSKSVDTGELSDTLDGVAGYISGTVTAYKKTDYSVKTGTDNGVSYRYDTLTYDVTTKDDRYSVSVVYVVEDKELKIAGFNVTRASEIAGNGSVIDFGRLDPVQLAFLVFSLLSLGFIVFTIIAAARSRIRFKPLWILIILLVYVGLSATVSSGSLRFSLLIPVIEPTGVLSSLRKFANGALQYTLTLPMGAILFLLLKKKLIDSAAKHAAGLQEEPKPPAGDGEVQKELPDKSHGKDKTGEEEPSEGGVSPDGGPKKE